MKNVMHRPWKVSMVLCIALFMVMVLVAGCAAPAPAPAPKATTPAAPAPAAKAKIELSMAGTVPPNDIKIRASQRFAEEVLQKTNGDVKITVFPNGQLIADKDMGTAMPAGMADLAQCQLGIFTNVADASVMDMCFTYSNDDHWWAVANGPLKDSITNQLATKSNCQFLAWLAQGPTDVWASTTKTIKTPEDMKGLKFRTPPSNFYVKAVTALGAAGTIISVNELYTALQTNQVSATFCNSRIYNENKWFEVAKYLSKLNNAPQSSFAIIANLDSWKKVPANYQKIIADAAKNVENWTRATKETEGYWETIYKLKDQGTVKEIYVVPAPVVQEFIKIVMPSQVAAIQAVPGISPGVVDLVEKARPK